eukprot:CAMPEP_0119552428 /NCGR_PEP_ID=MMETSP1352-20130426/5436_1 /TAXON_ID=265584 /ORGANISM="Stauroneis constricta, Strain CCMP1120" /LENGTH=294 /DNA_ID=CAMNT_0007598669 /DNA_START=31 /DNA_END=915 /DNA_ORIENTATION=-
MKNHSFVLLLELCMSATIVAAATAFMPNADGNQPTIGMRFGRHHDPLTATTTSSSASPFRNSVGASKPGLQAWLSLRGGDQAVSEVDPDVIDLDAPTTKSPSGLGAAVLAPLASFGRIYSRQLEARPIFTKSATAGFIFALSDYLAQKIERSSKEAKLDWTRLISSGLVGLLYFGPAAHYWYEIIFRLLPGTTLASTLAKAFWGQVIFGPSFTCIFFGVSLLQSGNFTLGNWWAKIRSDLPGAWLAGAGFWPLVDLISYSVVPIKWIPLFINMCSLVWTIYLSIVANKSSGKSS